MSEQPKRADQPPSLARRHFMGIAATTARRLAAVSITSSVLAGLNIREAAADLDHDRGGREGGREGARENEGRYESDGMHGRGGRHGSGDRGEYGDRNGYDRGRDQRSSRSAGGGRSAGGRDVSGGGSISGGGNGSGGGHESGGGYSSGGGSSSGGGGYASGGGSSGLRCFGRGTLIQTPDGEVAVEDLTVGTLVTTTNGAMPVKWIGRQAIDRNSAAARRPDVVPVRISAFAIDDQTPRRDLYLSQEHALYIDGALIPVKYLVNGRSIALDDNARRSETIEYFHIELDSHEVVFAEGVPAETFFYMGGEIAWDNLGEYRDRHGDHQVMSPFATIHSYRGVRAELVGLVRLAASRIVDVRDPIHMAYDRLAARAYPNAA